MAMLDELRLAFSGSPVTLDGLEKFLGADGVHELRREYFPRWRRSRAYAAGESVRGLKAVVVEDEFEGEIVKALAPREVSVRIRIRQPA
jgi:hypothetical protein